MGFYGNYYKINAGDGLIVKEKGQSIDIELEPYIINSIPENSLIGNISNLDEFNALMSSGSYYSKKDLSATIEIGQSIIVLDEINLTSSDYKSHYLDYNELVENKLKPNTVLVCVNDKPDSDGNNQFLFKNAQNLGSIEQIQELFWNKDKNKSFYFYDEEYEDSEFIENDSIIVDSQKQTIAIQKDGEEVVLGKNLPLEKVDGKNSVQSSDSDNEILADGSFGFGKGLKNKEQNQNQFIRGTYNEIDEEGKYIDIVGNGIDNEHRSNAYALDKEGNAYFSGDIYVKNGYGQSKLISELEASTPKEFVKTEEQQIFNISQLEEDNTLQGVKLYDWGNYPIKISSVVITRRAIFCNDNNSKNKIKWPYTGKQNELIDGLTFVWNSFGEIVVNGTTTGNPIYYFSRSTIKDATNLMAIIYETLQQLYENIDIKLVNNNEQLGLLIDTHGTPITFNNLIIRPFCSNEELSDLTYSNWYPPHGSIISLQSNGSLNLQPQGLPGDKFDIELYVFNIEQNLKAEYIVNINKVLNCSPDIATSQNQIALKLDTQYINAKCDNKNLKLVPVVSKSDEQPASVGSAYKISDLNTNASKNYWDLEKRGELENSNLLYNYLGLDDNNKPIPMGWCYSSYDCKGYNINYTTREARAYCNIYDIVANDEELKTSCSEEYKDWNEEIDCVLLVEKSYIYFLKYTNIYTEQVQPYPFGYDGDYNFTHYRKFYNGVICRYDMAGKEKARYTKYETSITDGVTDPKSYNNSLGVVKERNGYHYFLKQDTYLGEKLTSTTTLRSFTENVNKILHTKNFIILCYNDKEQFKTSNDYWYWLPQISIIRKDTLELIKMCYYQNWIVSNPGVFNGYLPLYHSDQIFMFLGGTYVKALQLLTEDLTMRIHKDRQSDIEQFGKEYITTVEDESNPSYINVTYHNLAPCLWTTGGTPDYTGNMKTNGPGVYDTKIFQTGTSYIILIHLRSSSDSDYCTIISIANKDDENNKIFNIPQNRVYSDKGKYNAFKPLFKAYDWYIHKNSSVNLYNLNSKYYHIQNAKIYFNYKEVDENDPQEIINKLINANDVDPKDSILLTYGYINRMYDKDGETVDTLFKDVYYEDKTTGAASFRGVQDASTAQRYIINYCELREDV